MLGREVRGVEALQGSDPCGRDGSPGSGEAGGGKTANVSCCRGEWGQAVTEGGGERRWAGPSLQRTPSRCPTPRALIEATRETPCG